MMSAWFWCSFKQTSSIVISGKKLQGSNNTRLEYSTNFFAILHQIKKLDCVSSQIHQLSEVPIQEPSGVSYSYEDYSDDSYQEDRRDSATSKGFETNLIVSQTEHFKMNEEIYGFINISKETDNNEKNPMKTEEFQITVSSKVLNADELRQTLAEWVDEYERLLNSDNSKYLKYFLYTPSADVSDDYYDATSHYSEFRFESGKSFENVFYPQKDDIVKRINFFTNNKAWYKKRGIPYTMGFMFYGDPGCGKTSTIKAIANHTQRHIVSVPLNKIKTAKELLNVFYNVKMNHKDIPLHKRLYVLEDIDAADLKEVVGERSKEKEEENEAREEAKEAVFDMNLLNLIKSSSPIGKFEANKLTLASLLEVLDGVMEMDGRMLIITTNYPEKLDKALIRPGRIDLKVKFGPCTTDNIVKMFEHYFETNFPVEFDISQLPDLKWTPADVTQVFLNNIHNPLEGLKQLQYQS
ncbi:MAG: AAA family ATPase [Gammaproteobacteria bacterium]|nr:AAA family ATPase [Gammaproteobacteria bacterium]